MSRQSGRDYRRRQYERALALKNAHAILCQHRHGSGVCGGQLEDYTDGAGRVYRRCPNCVRRLQGICRDCPRPVEGTLRRATRCAECKQRAHQENIKAWALRHADDVRAMSRRHYQEDPARRQRRNEYKRLYRKAHREKTRAQKRRAALRTDTAAYQRHLAWHRRYNARRRAEKAAAMTADYYATHPLPTPVCCDCQRVIPWFARGQKGSCGRPPRRCVFCEATANIHGLRAQIKRWAAKESRPTPAPVASASVTSYRPKAPARRLTDIGARLCWTTDCPSIVSGREKKCPNCKAVERAAAAAAIAQHHAGRGRRTDLARLAS